MNKALSMPDVLGPSPLDDIDQRLIRLTQNGLPLVREPYRELAEQLSLDAAEVCARFERLLASGVVRRIGVVPNHYRLGYTANGMSVWDVPDEQVDDLGRRIGALPFVSHCYHRPRHLPEWPYNLFAMVHGRSKNETESKIARIAAMLGNANRGHSVLYSTQILKKTGLRI